MKDARRGIELGDEAHYSMKTASLHYKAYEMFERNRAIAMEILGCRALKKLSLTQEELKLIDEYVFKKLKK